MTRAQPVLDENYYVKNSSNDIITAELMLNVKLADEMAELNLRNTV